MKSILPIVLMTFSMSAYSQNKGKFSIEVQKSEGFQA